MAQNVVARYKREMLRVWFVEEDKSWNPVRGKRNSEVDSYSFDDNSDSIGDLEEDKFLYDNFYREPELLVIHEVGEKSVFSLELGKGSQREKNVRLKPTSSIGVDYPPREEGDFDASAGDTGDKDVSIGEKV